MRPLRWLKKGKGFIRPFPGQGAGAVAGFSVLTLKGGKSNSENSPARFPHSNKNGFVLTKTISSSCRKTQGPGCKPGGWGWLVLLSLHRQSLGWDLGGSANLFSRNKTWAYKEEGRWGRASCLEVDAPALQHGCFCSLTHLWRVYLYI